jgi:hypothetical protein
MYCREVISYVKHLKYVAPLNAFHHKNPNLNMFNTLANNEISLHFGNPFEYASWRLCHTFLSYLEAVTWFSLLQRT